VLPELKLRDAKRWIEFAMAFAQHFTRKQRFM
jgi:hypothetical protein